MLVKKHRFGAFHPVYGGDRYFSTPLFQFDAQQTLTRMMISTRGRYALRVLSDLAEYAENGYVPMKDVAARQSLLLKKHEFQAILN